MNLTSAMWKSVTFLVLFVLTFLLGVPTSLWWVARKFWKVYAVMLAGFVVTFVPGFGVLPGVYEARVMVVWGFVVGFAVPFGVVFVVIGRAAWGRALQVLREQSSGFEQY